MNADVWIPLLTLLVSGVVGGIGWLFKTKREDRLADKKADLLKIDQLNERIFVMQQERIQEALKRAESGDLALKAVGELTAVVKLNRTALPQ